MQSTYIELTNDHSSIIVNSFLNSTEFLHGHLNNPGSLPAVICFRSKAFDDTRREEALAVSDKRGVAKFSTEGESATRLMDDLKARVKDSEQQVRAEKSYCPDI